MGCWPKGITPLFETCFIPAGLQVIISGSERRRPTGDRLLCCLRAISANDFGPASNQRHLIRPLRPRSQVLLPCPQTKRRRCSDTRSIRLSRLVAVFLCVGTERTLASKTIGGRDRCETPW